MENRTFVILAADDEEELLEALQLFLEREHMKLIKAADGPFPPYGCLKRSSRIWYFWM